MINADEVLCIMGPTAIGKSAYAEKLAERYPIDLISVDSAMIYRGMDIGTAKPSAEIRAEIPYYLIDILDPSETYSAADFCQQATDLITKSRASDRLPVLVGGTMMYFHALQQGLSELPTADDETREKLAAQHQALGLPALYAKLQRVDPKSAARIKANDQQRILRALEVYEISGQTMSDLWQNKTAKPAFNFKNIILLPKDRAELHAAIAKRFQIMLDLGFIDEVKQLFDRGDLHPQLPSIRAIAYRQAWQYLAGELSYEEMQERAVIATRQLAKRQITWCRQWQDAEIQNL